MQREDRYLGTLLGLACGDAVGTTVEFMPRGSFPPVTGMVGGGPFDLRPGEWTDDTSMALCLAHSLIHCQGFDAHDQMNRYVNWWHHGYMSATGECFDIGMTTRAALARYLSSGNPFAGSDDPRSAGNGSLMRLAPVVLWFYPDESAVMQHAVLSSRTTHAAQEAVECCLLMASVLIRALDGDCLEDLLTDRHLPFTQATVANLATGQYRDKTIDQVRGSGYAVESLEAALWCLVTTCDFESAVLAAANLGDDSDTTAAIVGQLAGAHYGVQSIPAEWLGKLAMREQIEKLALGLNRLRG